MSPSRTDESWLVRRVVSYFVNVRQRNAALIAELTRTHRARTGLPVGAESVLRSCSQSGDWPVGIDLEAEVKPGRHFVEAASAVKAEMSSVSRRSGER